MTTTKTYGTIVNETVSEMQDQLEQDRAKIIKLKNHKPDQLLAAIQFGKQKAKIQYAIAIQTTWKN